MKTKSMKILILLVAGISMLACRPAFCQTNYMATNQMVFPRHLGGGNGFPPIRTLTNSYPHIRIGGDGEDEEFQYFMASSRMFWGFFIERDKGPIHRGGKRCPF
jgi:hypothetical protein